MFSDCPVWNRADLVASASAIAQRCRQLPGRLHLFSPLPTARILTRGQIRAVTLGSCLAWLAVCSSVAALERLVVKQHGQTASLAARILTTAADGGMLVQDRAGVLWAIQPGELASHSTDETPFRFFLPSELQDRLLAELPEGFRAQTTANYVICHNTSPAYAQWCGSLYERLFRAFQNYWEHRGLELKRPELPLVAFVFADLASYERYARAELGEAARSVTGFYSLRTNRVAMYDLTGVKGLAGLPGRITSSAQINSLLLRPDAERMVATIIHEATHQLAFNCGLHTRYADIPLWASEGLAIFFETPDLRSAQGWRNVGAVHRDRLTQFRTFLSSRPADSLRTLIADDRRFRQGATALDAYAEAWALTYFLISTRSKQYVRYQQRLSAKPVMIYDSPEDRVREFEQAFEADLAALDVEFLRYVAGLR